MALPLAFNGHLLSLSVEYLVIEFGLICRVDMIQFFIGLLQGLNHGQGMLIDNI